MLDHKKYFSYNGKCDTTNNKATGGHSSIVVEVIRTVIFFYQDNLHKNKTHKYLNTPKKHNKSHSLGKKCLDKIANTKNSQ